MCFDLPRISPGVDPAPLSGRRLWWQSSQRHQEYECSIVLLVQCSLLVVENCVVCPYYVLGWCHKVLWRRLEDKLIANKIELRPFTLNLSLDDLHKNRELPSAYICYLGVPDSTLPLKGTAHRSVRGAPEIEHQVNLPLLCL